MNAKRLRIADTGLRKEKDGTAVAAAGTEKGEGGAEHFPQSAIGNPQLTFSDLHDAVIEGAVQRIRPKIMTVCAILFGLLPIMWSPTTQAGADVMKRIATPMIGGVVTSAILELLIYPVIFVLWKKREVAKAGAPLPRRHR